FDRAVKTDADAVTVRLKKPFAPFLSIMARWSYVTNKKWCLANGEWDGTYENLPAFNNRPRESSGLFKTMNGTGPFMLERWDRNAKQIYLAAFPGYWSSPAKIKHVIMRSAPDFTVRRALLEAGDADIIDLPRPYQAQAAALPGVRLEDNLPRLMTDPVFFFTLKLNPSGNPYIGSGKLDETGIPPDFFAGADIRKAFAYSFDYAGYLKEGFKGTAARARGTIPPGLLGYNPAAPVYEYNRTRAVEYFRKAYGGEVWNKGFRFTLTYKNGGEESRLACEMLKRNVEAMNLRFHIDLAGVDWPVYIENTLSRKMPLFTRGWTGDYPDPHNFVFPFYHSKGRYAGFQGYANPGLDKLIDDAVSKTSVAERQELYFKIQKIAYDEAIQLYTVHPKGLYALRDNVTGFYDNAVFMGIYFYPLGKQ
ncbi:MAG TPA: ABC transporter substrate-binding protein, partial [Elusimicrobiales bacterium]|nr:ABC transporter substrate-binding protein [Elusimicrobiales bacterium]